MAFVARSASPTEIVQAQLRGGRADWRGHVFRVLLLGALLFSLVVLVVLLVDVVRQSLPVLTERPGDFLAANLSLSPEQAGVWQAVRGSLWIAVFVVVLAFPVGTGAAVYLQEYAPDNRFTRFVDVNIRNLAGVPSVVYGILGLTIFVQVMGGFTGGRSVMAGGLTLAVLVLPIVIITAAEALRAVPDGIREAGFGVGATRWEVVRSHVLPYALPGILTGTILSVARALGEAAPLILVGAATGFFSRGGDASFLDELTGAFTALPMVIYTWTGQPQDEFRQLAAAAIVVLLAIVLLANTAAILLRNHYEKKR